jgi:hypothetical protein
MITFYYLKHGVEPKCHFNSFIPIANISFLTTKHLKHLKSLVLFFSKERKSQFKKGKEKESIKTYLI